MKEPLQGESMKKGKKKSGVNKDGNNAILSSFVDAAKDDGELMNPDTFQGEADIAAFHQAVKTRDYDKVKALLDSDKSLLCSVDSFRIPAVINAASKADINMLSLLLLSGADINQRGDLEETALICAVRNGFKEVTAFLIPRGAKTHTNPVYSRRF